MKKIPGWVIVVIILALLIGAKQLFFPKDDGSAAAAKNAQVKNMSVGVNYFVVKADSLKTSVFTAGKIGAYNQVDLVPELSGKVTGIYFTEGQSVEKGALLVKINDADYQAQLLKIKSQLTLAEQKLKRLEQLLKINGISQEDLDIQNSEVQVLKADEAYATAMIAKTSIVAPFSGQIGLKNISIGSYVTANTPVLSIVQTKPVYVEFSIPEKYNSLIHKGDAVKFRAEKMDSTLLYNAKVYAIEPRVDEATRSIKIRADYSGNQLFYPGSFVNTYINLGASSKALMVPTQAVIAILKGHKVYKAKNGIAEETPIKIGFRNDRQIQVLEGLQEGDTVLTTGLLSLRKGSTIKLLKTN